MNYFSLLFPLLWLVFSVFAAAKMGDAITRKTGRKIIGWTISIALFFMFVVTGGWIAA